MKRGRNGLMDEWVIDMSKLIEKRKKRDKSLNK